MRGLAKLLPVLAIAGAAAILAPTAASAASLDCNEANPPRVVQGKNASTTSKTFVAVPNSTFDLAVVSPATCFIFEFSAKLSAPAPQAIRVRITQPGGVGDQRAVDSFVPASMDFYTSGAASDGRAATFVMRNPAVGVHGMGLEFLSVKGGEVTLDSWTLIVRYDSGQ